MSRSSPWSLVVYSLLALVAIVTGSMSAHATTPEMNGSEIPSAGQLAGMFKAAPVEQGVRNEDIDFSQYRTFNWRAHPDCEDPAVAELLASVARSVMEVGGYEYLPTGETDLTLVVLYRGERGVLSRPARREQVPLSQRRGDVAYVPFDAVEVPGATSDTYTPEVLMFLIDNKRVLAGEKEAAVVWRGNSNAACDNGDTWLVGQIMTVPVVWSLQPGAQYRPPPSPVGIFIAFQAFDRKVLRPTVVWVDKGARADKAGIRVWDIVEEIDGKPLAGLSMTDVRKVLTDWSAGKKSLKLRRGYWTFTVTWDLAEEEEEVGGKTWGGGW